MGVAVRTIEVAGVRRWRDFDLQLVLYLLLLIGFGVVLGTSAWIIQALKPIAEAMISSTAPIIVIDWTITRGRSRVIAMSR